MSRVIIVSRKFPVAHPRKGEPTFFMEKIWASLADITEGFKIPDHCTDWDWHEYYNAMPKHHTIRSGNRWKEGDKFSPRIWSDKPYASKQIIIAPDIEIKKIWNFEWYGLTVLLNDKPVNSLTLSEIAFNDGLSKKDFNDWFNIHPKGKNGFKGQILCWNENINY